MQPNNEEIIKEIAGAEQYLRKLLKRLLALNATLQTLSSVVQALETINRSYNDSPQLISGYIGHSYSPNQELSASILEQIRKTIHTAINEGGAGN
ncbi:hypothetical protein [Nostoc sp.]|uniref:hypothetical protein n=1 Tax=Nostoc sp. TaxID=1180 RepID=UPI002FF5D7EA